MSSYKVAVYIYPGGDLLDFSGPIEIYSSRTHPNSKSSPDAHFEITTFAHHNPVVSQTSALVYIPNSTFDVVSAQIQEYDILVIPGAKAEVITSLIGSKEGQELSQLIQRFAALSPRVSGGKRILQSVCTGSILLAAAGVLVGRTVTTHHLAFDVLKQVADRAAGGDSKIEIVKKRWVDAGYTDSGVGIINAAGVSSGIDTSLWIYELFVGKAAADWAAEVAEFGRRAEAWGVSA